MRQVEMESEQGKKIMQEAIARVVQGEDLSPGLAEQVMEVIMEGDATPAQTGALLAALRCKGEKTEEVAGFARVMRRKAEKVPVSLPLILDNCGTGGDGTQTFNISTAAAFVIAGAGVPVAKHGNRAVSSRCGSADVLEALGVVLDLPPPVLARCLAEVGITFLFAPRLHPAMSRVAPLRRELGIRTVFNLLGPLTNPAGANVQVVGVFSRSLLLLVAGVLQQLGVKRAVVLHGAGGADEATLAGVTHMMVVEADKQQAVELDPLDLGLPRAPLSALAGGGPEENARLLRNVLAGKKGVHLDAVLLNAAVGLWAAGVVESVREGLELAARSVQSGAALAKLEQLCVYSRRGG